MTKNKQYCAFYQTKDSIICNDCTGTNKTKDCYIPNNQQGLDIVLKKLDNDTIHLAMHCNVPETQPINIKERTTKE